MGSRIGIMTGRRQALRLRGLARAGLLAALLAITSTGHAAQSFGNLLVSPQVSHEGNTHHGYREFRVLLENRSASETHRVTLMLPDRSFGWGNTLRRLQRTAVLGPGAQASVSLWQPPLPMFSGGGMEVIVDGDSLGSAHVPQAQRHVAPGSARGHSGIAPTTVLVSRSLDPEEFSRSLHGGSGLPLSAAMATGAPDAGTVRGFHPNAWMPNPSLRGPHWIELTYATPIPVNNIQIHQGQMGAGAATLLLQGVSGTNLGQIHLSLGGSLPPGMGGMPASISVPLTVEPVESIRLEFATGSASTICIDAVEISGPSGKAWATSARASSDATGSAPAYLGRTSQSHRQFLRAELPISEWSGQWLSYTAYDAVVLGRTDQSLLPGPVHAALRSYVEAGGNLFLLGDPDARDRWQGADEGTPIENGHRIDIGFGRCFVIEAEKPADLGAAVAKAMLEAADASARFWHSLPMDEGANSLFPVVENVAIPVRGIVLVMLAFVLLIGPVNLIVLSRLKRRTWMLWTIPAISLVSCAGVFLYSFVREGFTPDCRLEGLTFLDQANRRAATVGAAAFYCPLTPSEGLRFSPDTEATPLVQSWDHRSGTQRELDWTQAQHLRRGWVTARVPAHFYLRKSEPRRERLQLSRADGALEVVNGLGAPVISLLLLDSAGRLHEASRIAPGQKAPLALAAETPPPGERLGPHPLFLQAGFAGQRDLLSTNAASYLLPGTYLAELTGSPFLESGLGERSARTRTRAFVYGILEPLATP